MGGEWIIWSGWGVLIVSIMIAIIKMILQFPGILEIKLVHHGKEEQDEPKTILEFKYDFELFLLLCYSFQTTSP